jgi:hypothetical protein
VQSWQLAVGIGNIINRLILDAVLRPSFMQDSKQASKAGTLCLILIVDVTIAASYPKLYFTPCSLH